MAKNKVYLLDTHIFLWWMESNSRLNDDMKKLLTDQKNDVLLSVISIWEIVIKKKTGKLEPPHDWKETLSLSKFPILPVTLTHVFTVENLPSIHHDPFDRMLIAQAQAENFVLITDDEKIKKYSVSTIA